MVPAAKSAKTLTPLCIEYRLTTPEPSSSKKYVLTVSPSTLKPVVVRIPPDALLCPSCGWKKPLPKLITNPSDLDKFTCFLFLSLTFVILDSIAVLDASISFTRFECLNILSKLFKFVLSKFTIAAVEEQD